MSNHDTKTPDVTDAWIDHPNGRLFSRMWTPPQAAEPALSRAPIVLLHDSLGSIELWRDFPAALCAATGHRVIAYDRLGFGRSDPGKGAPPMDFIAEEARSYFPVVREQLGFSQFIVLGHSVGGGMAVNCAAAFPADCKALITVAAQAFPEDLTLEGIRQAKEQFKDARQIERLGKYHGDKARWVLDAWIETWLHPAFATWTLAPVLPRVTCPLLAIHGIHDEYGSIRHPETISQLSGSSFARLEIMPDTGHTPHRERPETVIRLVSQFVEQVS